jgi:hypothetical protein
MRLAPVFQAGDSLLMRVGDASQAVNALHHVREELFVLHLHVTQELDSLHEGLQSFVLPILILSDSLDGLGEGFQAFIDVHLYPV